MKSISIKEKVNLDRAKVERLYNDVGWTAYTKDMDNLMMGIDNSLGLISAWDGEELIGLIRLVGDGFSIIYIQDILVLESYHRQGIGRQLLEIVLDRYKSVRQIVLATEDTDKTKKFYESIGFRKMEDMSCLGYMKINI